MSVEGLARAMELHRAGRLQDAAKAYVDVLRRRPDHADALQLLGMVMHALGHAEQALDLLNRAVAADKRHAPAHANRGLVLLGLGRRADAAAALRRAVRLQPDLAEAWSALGSAELPDRPEHGVRALAEALRLDPVRRRAVALADALSPLPDPPADLVPALRVALSLDGVDHSRLDRAVRSALGPLDDERLVEHPLFAAWLGHVVVAHPEWEPRLARIRRDLLARALGGPDVPLDAVVALALHAWATEFAAGDAPDGLDRLDPDRADHAAVRAMFEPLRWSGSPGPLAELVRVTVDEPAEEARAAVPEITDDDPTSASVRAMYEESPYPRLVSVHVREPGPLVLPDGERRDGPFDVLVAGCGTGRHALQSATAWAGARVLGVDLSRRSLARADRLARRLGVTNLELRRGDLLRLGALDRRFDVVEAVGVLHHLEDPLAGWGVLRSLVRPGGLMRVGLYSERGRQDVVAARALVAERGWQATPDGIRAARRALLALPDDHPARPVVWSPDFYSLSGARDLVFHVREHRYTPGRVRAELDALGLELVGFQHALPQVAALVEREGWETVENQHPRAFSGMYVFWAR